MIDYVLPPPPTPSLPVLGTAARFAVGRVFCVGRNYADHAREMGADPDREPPFFFQKDPTGLTAERFVRYPPATADLHHEIELVVALRAGGADVAAERAADLVYGYAVGVDLTRRDRQAEAKRLARPWEIGKSFDDAAPCSAIAAAGHGALTTARRIWLEVDGVVRQQGQLAQMIWSVPEIVAELSKLQTLRSGDLIFTGTPAGVGALDRGAKVQGGVDGVGELAFELV